MNQVKLKLFSQGYYVGNGAMKSVKNNRDSVSPMNEVETISATIWAGTTAVETKSATLLTDGTASFTFDHSGEYVVSVKTKNALEVSTPSALTLGEDTVNYDFTIDASQAFGSNQVEVESGVFALYSGDINQDGVISEADRALWEIDSNNAEFGDFATDLDGSGGVDPSDFSVWEANIGKTVMRP